MSDSTRVFLDTSYVYALINTRDQWHGKAKQCEHSLSLEQRTLVTSQFVLMEIADGLSAIGFREHAIRAIDSLAVSSFVEIVPATPQLFDDAMDLYRKRSDKEWGLTDCTSFVTMRQRGLHDALTTDQHFLQAGFRPLLLAKS